MSTRKVLNVGGGDRRIALPPLYNGWEQIWLDLDVMAEPDIVCDGRELGTLPAAEYDAVYCSHNLEHYYRHEVPAVLAGFAHVLKPDGFAHIRVPDVAEVMRIVVREGMDIDDDLYESANGPITVNDVIFGWGREIERTGNDFYAHKTGFTPKSLVLALTRSGFAHVVIKPGPLEIVAYAFTQPPGPFAKGLLGITAS